MNKIDKKLLPFGVQTASILIPQKGIDLKRWAVVACDQYSSQPEYWKTIADEIGDAPSTLNLIFPECYLNKGNDEEIINSINRTMKSYYSEEFGKVFQEIKESFILVKREFKSHKVRYGLICLLDLDRYDFNKGSTSLIRATEGTILERIPPRLKIRKEATLELPHIMVLVDDREAPLIEPLIEWSASQQPLYQTDLLQGSGTLTGYQIEGKKLLNQFTKSLKKLSSPKRFKKKYHQEDLLLFAIGDGNHSLATAKTAWENLKKELSPEQQKDHPARFALVELNSIYDQGIEFEPIHRVLFHADGELFLKEFTEQFDCTLSSLPKEALLELAQAIPQDQQFAFICENKIVKVVIHNPDSSLTVGTLQAFLDQWMKKHTNAEIDFIHGIEATFQLSTRPKNFGLVLPNISKSNFFNTVIQDGSFPRKTFSMGEADEKRFYFEARKITP